MSGNSFGTIFRITTFGESHGDGIGVVVDGCPAGIQICMDRIQQDLDKRKPGGNEGQRNPAVTARKEADKVEILSGIFEGKTEGTPIALFIRNTSQHSSDYANIKNSFRPGHADYTYFKKYGFRDYRGGGRSSGRETAARVAAGAIAKAVLSAVYPDISITAYTLRAAGVQCEKISFDDINKNPFKAADCTAASEMAKKIETYRKNGDSCGGIIECSVQGVPAGLGEPVFDKLDAELAHAMLSIGAVKGIEFGSGFAAADTTGSANNDAMRANGNSNPKFTTNNAGGILGGISNGNNIVFRIAVKPVPSIYRKQLSVRINGPDKDLYTDTDIVIEGRHDVCLCPRIVPVVEAMTAIVLTDMTLCLRNSRIDKF